MKKLWKHFANTGKKFIRRLDRKNVVFSIGENCLTDDLLSRNNLKSFSSPYSTGRSNIEYILAFEQEQFSSFLCPDYLTYETVDNKRVVRNSKYVSVKNSYHPSVLNGFEFTHHDVLGDRKARQTMQKRCERQLRLKNKNIVMLYHHRYCENTDVDFLCMQLSELAQLYRERGNKVSVLWFTQIPGTDPQKRRIEKLITGDTNGYTFYTEQEWKGSDPQIFFGRSDDDLFREMIRDIKMSLK